VGIWDDEMTRFYKGEVYPIQSLQERVLMTLACKHVDDIVIGAPYIITEDLIKSLNIDMVVRIINTEEDTVLE
jgi:ethanolamine-phosphate cytidylyltransferase